MDDRWAPVVEELRERFAPDTDVVEVEAYLSSEGYDRRQIGEIVLAYLTENGPGDSHRSETGQVGQSELL